MMSNVMEDPRHHEDCMCDDCIKFQELVEAGEAEYEVDALNKRIEELEAFVDKVSETARQYLDHDMLLMKEADALIKSRNKGQ